MRFEIPNSPPKSVYAIDDFRGVDFTNSPANMEHDKSPNMINMIRSVPSKIRKSTGLKKLAKADGMVNGAHILSESAGQLLHIGTKLYKYNNGDEIGSAIYEGMANNKSKSWQFEDKLYIVDGKKMLRYDGINVVSVDTIGYIPTLTISKDPNGGGKPFENLNLLQSGFREKFLGKKDEKVYQLTFGGLDEKKVEVELLNADGEWIKKEEGKDYSVNRTTGTITFIVAPNESPVTGEDNIKITAYRSVEGYSDRINKCDIGALFGVNGAQDRLFLSGNSDYKNYDWYSGQHDPTYFSDTSYSIIGSSRSAIIGYSIISNYLATHKDGMETDQSVIVRQGDLIEDKPAFKITNTLQGSGAIAKNSFDYLSTEPLFLTQLGVYAITAQDITGEKYAQNRSFYLNGRLLLEEQLNNAHSVVFEDFYYLAVGANIYILDGLQPLRSNESMPYATRQYAGFFLEDIYASCMWVYERELYVGRAIPSEGGYEYSICKFYSDVKSPYSYYIEKCIDGKIQNVPMTCTYETPDISGQLFYKNKAFRYLAIRLATAIKTGVKAYGMRKGLWTLIHNNTHSASFLSFRQLKFSQFTFSSDNTEKVISTKVRIKKVDKARFRLSNDNAEPFGLQNFALEYTESNNYKG